MPLNQTVVARRSGTCAKRDRNAATFPAPVIGLPRRRHQTTAVGDQHHFGGEHFHQSLHVARGDGGHELLDRGQLLGPIHLHPRPPRCHVFVGTMRNLPDGGRALAHHLGDLLVGRLEHLAEDEDGSLRRTEGLQHREHGNRDVLGQLCILGHVGAGEQRLGQPFPHVLLPRRDTVRSRFNACRVTIRTR